MAKDIENPIKPQNEFQWIIKHVFWQDYFLQMGPTPKAKYFEYIENIFLVKWFKK